MPTLKTQNLWLRRAPWLTALAALVAAIGTHVVAQRPASNALADVRARLGAARVEVARAREAAARLPRIEREVEDLRRKLQAERHVPRNQDLGQFIRDVTGYGQDAALSKLTVQPGVPRRRELVSEVPVSLSFEGDFLGACAFLRRAEGMRNLTAVRGLTIRTVDPAAGRVEVQLSMNLYFADAH